MSVNYAAGLSDYPNKGKCGQPELSDTDEQLDEKLSNLVEFLKLSKHCVVLTGAGVSTACGIPDFRGPQGVWTLEERGIAPSFATTFDQASFSKGHMALVALEKTGYIKYLVTQNVDGLHLRSGFPRDKLSILHGDMFIEQCEKCRHQYIRKSSVRTMGLKLTGNPCTNLSRRGQCCRGKLRDTILDWEDSLPNDQLDAAYEQTKRADLFLVLGSSLQILPAGNLPLLCKRNRGTFVSVNLQKTKYHKKTDLAINSTIDKVMTTVCERLGVAIPHQPSPVVRLHSIHGSLNTLSFNVSVDNELLETDKTAEKNDIKTIKEEKSEDIAGSKDSILKRKSNIDIDLPETKMKPAAT